MSPERTDSTEEDRADTATSFLMVLPPHADINTVRINVNIIIALKLFFIINVPFGLLYIAVGADVIYEKVEAVSIKMKLIII